MLNGSTWKGMSRLPKPAGGAVGSINENWMGRGLWAVLEQGLFATGNFILTILLGRWLTPVEYGAYALAFCIFLFLMTIHTSFLTEPMLVYGAGKYRRQFRRYFRFLLWGHWGLSLILSLLFIPAGLILQKYLQVSVGSLFTVLALVSPMILFLWLTRRAYYAQLRTHVAAVGGVLYFVVVVSGAFLLDHWIPASAVNAFLIMGFAATLSGLVLYHLMGEARCQAGPEPGAGEVLRDHLAFGVWAAPTTLAIWIPANLGFLLLPVWHGLEASGGLKAVSNLLLPVLHVTSAIGTLLVPALVQVDGGYGTERFRARARVAGAGLLLVAVLFWTFLTVYRSDLLFWFYGAYTEYGPLLILIGLVPMLNVGGVVLAACLKAGRRQDLVFRANLAAASLAVVIGIPLVAIYGVAGAIGTHLLALTGGAILMLLYYRRLCREEPAKGRIYKLNEESRSC